MRCARARRTSILTPQDSGLSVRCHDGERRPVPLCLPPLLHELPNAADLQNRRPQKRDQDAANHFRACQIGVITASHAAPRDRRQHRLPELEGVGVDALPPTLL